MTQPMVCRLLLLRPDEGKEEYRIDQADMTIGSGTACDIVIEGLGLVTTHARIEEKNGHYTILNLDPAAETIVNDTRVDASDLQNNDVIQLGDAKLRVVLTAAALPSPAADEATNATEQADSAQSEQASTAEELLALLQTTALFQMLDDALVRELAHEMRVMSLVAEQPLVRQGEPGDAMYVILEGRLRVVIDDQVEGEKFRRLVGSGDIIGEVALLTGQTRTATVIADEAVKVATLTKVRFDELISTSPAVANTLAEAITNLISQRQMRTVLNATEFFQRMEPHLRQASEAELQLVRLRSGERLFRQGDVGDGMYVVVSGRVKVVLEDAIEDRPEVGRQKRRILRELGTGESLGEIALLSNQPRTASVYAMRDSELAKLSRESYLRLVEQYPLAATSAFTQPVIDLVVSRDQRVRESGQTTLTMVLIPASPDLPLTEFAQRLQAAFARLGPTRSLNSQQIDEILGKQGIAQTALSSGPYVATHGADETVNDATRNALDLQLVNWLGEQEEKHRYLIYQADFTLTPWTRRAIRQADHVLLVGQGNGNPSMSAIEAYIKENTNEIVAKRESLVLVHRGSQGHATGTARWLSGRQVENYYHIHWHGGDKDFARLARILAGRAVSLVLSGGGVRGAAHIGVLRVLEEAGIPVDMICGVSAGSAIAAFFAMGYDLATVQQQFARLMENFSTLNTFRSVTLPVVAFTTGYSMTSLYKSLFGNLQIEDLSIPFFSGTANLSRARDQAVRAGSLWQAVRASTTMPGVVPPLVWNGDLFIDGGLYNTLPLDTMRALNPHGVVIGIDVMAITDMTEVAPYGAGLSGWQALANLISPQQRKEAVPNILSLLYRVLEVSSVQSVQEHLTAGLADLYLRPPVSHFALMDAGDIDAAAEVGYHYAKEHLAEWISNSAAVPIQNSAEKSSAEKSSAVKSLEKAL